MKYLIFIILSLVMTSVFSQEKTFNITRNTIFLNEKGEKLSFEDFALLTTKYKSKLLPTFNSENKLEYITLTYPAEAAPYVGENRIKKEEEIITIPVVLTEEDRYNNNYKSNSIDSDAYSNVKELPGMLAPHFSMNDQFDNIVDINNLKGTVVVLKFWFSKCAPCVEEMPYLNNLVTKYITKNVKFYAPSVERRSLTQDFLNYNVFYYNTLFEAQDLAALYKTPGYPTHVVIGKDSRVRKVIVGKRTNIYKILNEEIKIALLMDADDVNILELDENESFVLNNHTIIVNEKGERITKEEYIYSIKTGRFKIYKKIKKNGNTHLLITTKN